LLFCEGGRLVQVERGVGKKQGTFRKVYAHDYSRIDIASGHREGDFAGAVNGAAVGAGT
jgi:hypothetical protein